MTGPERRIPRRTFLATSGAALAAGSGALGPVGVPAVEAVPTVFHAHPDGIRTLVRFIVRNSEAPAGRLRVYDERTSDLIGTAGVLPAGDERLVGELWLPLQRRLRIRTEFEYPGTRRPLRDRFTLDPTPRWTLHWLLLADPDAIRRRVAGVRPEWRFLPTATLAATGVQLDPVRTADPRTDLEAARIAWPAYEVGRQTGMPLAPLGTALRGFAALPTVMRASGLAGTVGMIDEPWTLLDTLPGSLPALQRLVEERLVAEEVPLNRGFVIVPVAGDAPGLPSLIDAWTARFAAPVLALGTAPADLRARSVTIPRPPLPQGPRALADRAQATAAMVRTETLDMFRILAVRAGADGAAPLDDIARRLRYPGPGRVVFNPGPWGRTDVVHVDGGEQIVTNVPGPGYAIVPADPPLAWPEPAAVGTVATVANDTWRLRTDAAGGVASLVHQPSGTNLAGPSGLCAVEGARAMHAVLARRDGLGERLTVVRTAGGFRFTTTYTLYEGLETVEVTQEGGAWDHALRFDPAPGRSRTRWAEPLGTGSADGAFGPVAARAWFTLDGDDGSLIVATPDGAILERAADGRLVCHNPEGGVRFRIAFARPALPEDAWRVAALGLPLIALDAPGTGTSDLPTFGRLLDVHDPGVRLIGIRGAADGVGIVVYLHDVMGFERTVSLRAGVFRFSSALACDLLERDRGPLATAHDAVAVPVPAGGIAAVRLLGG